jgi:DNA-binding XRE family transcriptional regulator
LKYQWRSIELAERIITRFFSAETWRRNRNDHWVSDERLVGVAFGQRLAQLRTEHQLTQEELAYRSEMHRTAVANLEKGTNVPRLDTVLKLAAALDMNPCQLIEGLPEWKLPSRAHGRFEV